MSHDHLKIQSSAFEPYSTPKREKLKRSCLRWWWLYLLTLVALVLIIVLPIIYVGYPHIAQSKVNDASISIEGIKVDELQPHSFRMSLNATITNPSSDQPYIGPFNASIFLPDGNDTAPFAYVQFPRFQAGRETTLNLSQIVNVTNDNYAALVDFNRVLLRNETFRITTSADRVPLKLSRLPTTHVDFEKTVTLNGLRSLSSLGTGNLSFALVPDAIGDTTHLDILVPNPSVFTLDLGRVSMDEYVGDSKVGTAYIPSFYIVPGNVTVRSGGRANLNLLAKVVQRPYCETGIIPFRVETTDVTVNGTRINYVAEALAGLEINEDVPFRDAVRSGVGIDPQCGINILASLGLANVGPSTATLTDASGAASAPTPTALESAINTGLSGVQGILTQGLSSPTPAAAAPPAAAPLMKRD